MSSLNSQVRIEFGLPPHEFFGAAWKSEPLTQVLKETNISKALPFPDADVSHVAKDGEGRVVGQCSANNVVKYWEHVEQVDVKEENLSTQIFVNIHKKAVAAEREYLNNIGEPLEKALHNAGVAVLPEYRGRRIGLALERAQNSLCSILGKTTLFCETTNRYSAQIMEKSNFQIIVSYPYADLADTLHHPDLHKLDGDAFTVWCLKV